LVDLRRLELFGSGVFDDLNALPLLHVVDNDLANHTVRKDVVERFDLQIIEEVRGPEATEVLFERHFNRVVVCHPHILRRTTWLRLDVIEIGLRLDDGGSTLLLKAWNEDIDDGRRPRWWNRRGWSN